MRKNLLASFSLLSALVILSGGSCAKPSVFSGDGRYDNGYLEGQATARRLVDTVAWRSAATENRNPDDMKVYPKRQRSDFSSDAGYEAYLKGWEDGADSVVWQNSNNLGLKRHGADHDAKD
jgi:hypothetical protein